VYSTVTTGGHGEGGWVANRGNVFHAIASARHSEPSASLGNVIG